ncbi:MAG: MFS transporter [Gammaproteobacteria bacterium]|nr:MFS transporter [Gammaproteobacteria bacterium]
MALPIPFIFLFGPSWNWIVAANVLLGIKLIAAVGDISHPDWRGSSLGVYRFWRDLGYGIGALLLGLIADANGYA